MPTVYRRMHHDELDGPSWDGSRREAKLRILICSTPRSGSYLLCRQMINAGLGLPTEYLRPVTRTALSRRWSIPPGDDAAYFDEVEARRTGANGVFAAKVQWGQFERHPGLRERWLDRADLVVFLYRHDLVAQAVSWQLSLATGLWSFDDTRGPTMPGVTLEPSELTLRLAATLREHNRAWNAQIVASRRPALALRYETYVGAQSGLLQQLARRIGLRDDEWTMPPPEARDNRLPATIEEARSRLLAHARKAAADLASA